jgi:streptogramin lyase
MIAWIKRFRMTGLCATAMAIAIAIAGCSGDSSERPAPPIPTATRTRIVPTPTPTPVPTATPTPATSISGKVMGGLGPISGSQVTLYQAGADAYRADATALGTATADSSGRFTIGFTAPASPALLYLVALGGNGGGGFNNAIGLMGVVGRSDSVGNPVTLNELTTVAGEWALSQFLDSTGQQAGASASNATGLMDAAAQATDNLIDPTTGEPVHFLPSALECSSGLPPVNCDGLDRLNTLANIIAACVQSSGPSVSLPTCGAATAACDILLACSSTPADGTTLEAAHSIAANPAGNVSSLFAAQGIAGPYQPALTTAPEAFEIALNFFPLAAGLNNPIGLAIDLRGDLWIANTGGNSVVELSSTGRFLGRFAPTAANFDRPYDLAISEKNDIWITNANGASVTELNSTGALIANRSPASALINQPFGIEIDAADNVWMANFGNNSMSELTASSGYASGVNFAPAGAVFSGPVTIAIDTNANVWAGNFIGDSISELTASSSYASGFNFAPAAALLNTPLGLGLDASNNVWVANLDGSNISELIASSAYTTGLSFSPAGAALNESARLKLDSAGNVWTLNFGTGTLGVLLAGCNAITCNGLNFDPPGAVLNSPSGITVDAAGNIWIADAGDNSISEFIGLAAPTGVPVVCLKAGQSASCLP